MSTTIPDLVPRPIGARPARLRRVRALFESRSMPAFLVWPFAILISAFVLQFAIFLIYGVVLDRAIKLGSLFWLIAAFPYYRMPPKFRWTLALFAALFTSAVIASITSFDAVGFFQVIKVILGFLILPIVVLRFRRGDAPSPTLVKLLIFWGFLFAIQTLACWALILQNHPPPATVIRLERLDNMEERSFGIFGYGNAAGWIAQGFYYFRPQGWFLEPSNLGSFLLYPTFAAFGVFLTTRKLRFLIAAIVCGSALVFTFSLAGYVSALAAIVALALVRPRRIVAGPRPWYFWILPIVIAIAFVGASQFLMSRTYDIHARGAQTGYGRFSLLLGRDPSSQRLVQPYYKVTETARLLIANPLGIGLGNTLGFNETTSANALVYWAVAGGIPAIATVIFLLAHLTYSYCIPMLMSRVCYYRYIAASFIALSVHSLANGTWTAPFYLLVVALMILGSEHLNRLASQESAA